MVLNEHQQRSLEVLEKVNALQEGDDRLEELLIDFSDGFARGWYMHVRPCFREALDIRMTARKKDRSSMKVWTQGRNLGFRQGDVLYGFPEGSALHDAPDACQRAWRDVMAEMSCCFDVGPGTHALAISFTIYVPDEHRRKLVSQGAHTIDQFDFVRALIVGPDDL